MSKRLLQIDSCLNMLSTGRITESIGGLSIEKGWDVYIIHGARYVRNSSCMHSIQSVSKWGEYLHFAESLLFDNHGLASRRATKKIIELIKRIKPDIIQLHCVHGYYINYQILFEYLNTTSIPIVWTFHDCWAFTGHCAHFVTAGCEKWKNEGCHDCPLNGEYPKSLVDRSDRNFKVKKHLFQSNRNLHIVAVSDWLASFTKESFLGDKDIRVINNGVDVSRFRPCGTKSYSKFNIIGVASTWNRDKGFYDFYKIRETLPQNEYKILLVGLSEKQISELPDGIDGITRTDSVDDLVRLYSEANVLLNPTYADSFPTVNMEALACGTPVITYRTGGSPEIIDTNTGVVVEQGDINGIISAISDMKEHPLSSEKCRERAVAKYDKDKRYMDYINMYESLIKK